MKKLLATALIGAAMGQAMAVRFEDAIGDVNAPMTTYGNPNVDLVALEITDDGTNLTVTFTTNGALINDPNWIKCVMAMRRGVGPLNTALTTGWPRNFNLLGGSDTWLGGWVDGAFGGFEWRVYNGTDWGGGTPFAATWLGTPGMFSQTNLNTVSYTIPLATVGLAAGNTFHFDASPTGGDDDDGAWDPIGTIEQQITAPDQNIQLAGNLMYKVGSSSTNQLLTGSFTLNDSVAAFAAPRNFQIQVMQGTSVIASKAVSSSVPLGTYSVAVPSSFTGPATVVINGASFLKKSVAVTLTGSALAVGLSSVSNGDVDYSGEVDAADIDQVIADFGATTNKVTDVDQSGEVDAADIDIVIANFGRVDN